MLPPGLGLTASPSSPQANPVLHPVTLPTAGEKVPGTVRSVSLREARDLGGGAGWNKGDGRGGLPDPRRVPWGRDSSPEGDAGEGLVPGGHPALILPFA